MPLPRTIVTFSHLRWDSVYQRPHHLLSRLARQHRVVVVEEPVPADTNPSWDIRSPVAGVEVFRPRTRAAEAGFSPEQLAAMVPLMDELRARIPPGEVVTWLYTPLALPLAGLLQPDALVYDCMDELSLFLGAPPELLVREAQLLERADVVFTGGRSLYRAKRDRHANVHCFPSSVDAGHFGRARPDAPPLEAPADQVGLPAPRLGFFGVLDERMDFALLEHLGREHPAWSIVLVGPVAKIDPAALPRLPNITYTGQRSYDELPAYLAGWDVCLLPFARNDATRYISPTKILEYMAAERPIVSTRIADVAEPYGEIAYLADTPEQFVRACERALAAPGPERKQRRARMRTVVAGTSWDATVAAMDRLVTESLSRSAVVGGP
jgi:UDP-galactopyranose mutase